MYKFEPMTDDDRIAIEQYMEAVKMQKAQHPLVLMRYAHEVLEPKAILDTNGEKYPKILQELLKDAIVAEEMNVHPTTYRKWKRILYKGDDTMINSWINCEMTTDQCIKLIGDYSI